MKNQDVRELIHRHQLEWYELASRLKMPFPDFCRRMNRKQISPPMRKHLMEAISKMIEHEN